MTKPPLTVERLRDGGFEELGCWEVSEVNALRVSAPLPAKAGVYAFAIDGVVQYVGVAANSLKQRFGFYAKPGRTQTTSIRLNETIRGRTADGSTVQVLVAHPSDGDWNGLKISGPEGLEAGLIRDFDLPWNVRGARPTASVQPATATRKPGGRVLGVSNRILELVRRRSGMTELEIATAIYGPAAVQQQVNQHCRALLRNGRLQRRGSGGPSDPYVYVIGR